MAVSLILYLGVAVGSAVLAGSDLIPEPCLQGPEVWCKDLMTATECKREDYCLALQSAPLWEKLGEEDNALALPKKCLTCTKIMQKLKDLVGDDLDGDTIDAAFKSTCKAVSRLLSKLCRSVLKKFKDQIVDALQNNEDAQGVCVDIGMCKSPSPVWARSDLVPEACLQGSEFWCKDVVTAIECKREEYCWISLLPGKLVEEEERFIKCTLCIKFMQKLKALAGDNPSEEKIDAAIHNLCHVVGKFFGGACKRVVRLFRNEIVAGLRNNDDARKLCMDIKTCRCALPEPEIDDGSW